MISALIRTLNEECNLPRCLASLSWCDDIVVVDSGSSDGTVDIARRAGARVIHRPMQDESDHLNWAVREIPYKHGWVYCSDADEVVTDELRDEMLSLARPIPDDIAAYRVRFKNMFMGRWIRHASLYPTWVLRLFRPDRVHWIREVNPIPVLTGREGRLRSHFLHFSFNKGLNAWFEKHNRYSWREAKEALKVLRLRRGSLVACLRGSPAERRLALKEFSFRLPFRPLLRFLYMFIIRRGALDGRAGLDYCVLLSIYEYMIDLKIRELQRRERGIDL